MSGHNVNVMSNNSVNVSYLKEKRKIFFRVSQRFIGVYSLMSGANDPLQGN